MTENTDTTSTPLQGTVQAVRTCTDKLERCADDVADALVEADDLTRAYVLDRFAALFNALGEVTTKISEKFADADVVTEEGDLDDAAADCINAEQMLRVMADEFAPEEERAEFQLN